LWGGWAVFSKDFQWYFSGDAGYSKDFADTKAFFEKTRPNNGRGKLFDLALLAVGAYEPRWFMTAQHINPAEAVQTHIDLNAERSIGIHWGTFNLTDEALDVPPQELARARAAKGMGRDVFDVLKIGETRSFLQRSP
jgi:N-acyl-phosphatidylethanolamine-hydrolysing phospholipase D